MPVLIALSLSHSPVTLFRGSEYSRDKTPVTAKTPHGTGSRHDKEEKSAVNTQGPMGGKPPGETCFAPFYGECLLPLASFPGNAEHEPADQDDAEA